MHKWLSVIFRGKTGKIQRVQPLNCHIFGYLKWMKRKKILVDLLWTWFECWGVHESIARIHNWLIAAENVHKLLRFMNVMHININSLMTTMWCVFLFFVCICIVGCGLFSAICWIRPLQFPFRANKCMHAKVQCGEVWYRCCLCYILSISLSLTSLVWSCFIFFYWLFIGSQSACASHL